MKNVVSLFGVAALLLFVCGCGEVATYDTGRDEPSAFEDTESDPEDIGSDTYDASSNDSVFKSIEDVVLYQNENYFKEIDADGYMLGESLGDYLYKYDGASFYDLSDARISDNATIYKNRSELCLGSYKEESEFHVIDCSASEQLVLVMSDTIYEEIYGGVSYINSQNPSIKDSYPIYRLNYEGYCIPAVLQLKFPIGSDYIYCRLTDWVDNDDSTEIDAIEGKYVSDIPNGNSSEDEGYINLILDDISETVGLSAYSVGNESYILYGDFGTEITFGKYSGTLYDEFTYNAAAVLYSGSSVLEISAELTQKGFLNYDLSQMQPGLYLFMNKAFVIK